MVQRAEKRTAADEAAVVFVSTTSSHAAKRSAWNDLFLPVLDLVSFHDLS